MSHNLLERLSLDPQVMVGKPVIRGTRIPVELILKMMAEGISREEILGEYPRLQALDIQAASEYAASVVADEIIVPLY